METNIERRDAILALRKAGKTYSEIAKELNCTKSLVSFYCNPKRYNSVLEEQKKLIARKEYEELVCQLISECANINQVCKALGKKCTNTNIRLINDIITKYNLDVSHFTIDYSKKRKLKRYSLDDIFCENSTYKTISLLKHYLIKNNIKEWKCECCGKSTWMGRKIPLQTHHINGNNTDNRLENLQLLCPNCHAITDTYCGKNKQNKRQIKRIYKTSICHECGKEFYGKTKFCSTECFTKHKLKQFKFYTSNINHEQLKNILLECKSFTCAGRKLGVSDKTIVKWCTKFGLPNNAKDLKIFIKNNIK